MKEKNLKKKSRSDWARIDALRDEDIDFSDIEELGEAFFRDATIRLPEKKVPICIRLDREVVDWFKARGKRYQSRINAVLRAFIERQQSDSRQPYFKGPPQEEGIVKGFGLISLQPITAQGSAYIGHDTASLLPQSFNTSQSVRSNLFILYDRRQKPSGIMGEFEEEKEKLLQKAMAGARL